MHCTYTEITVNQIKHFVGYIIMPPRQTGNTQLLFSQQVIQQQEKRIQEFIDAHPGSAIDKVFVETGDHQRHRHRWPELEAAVSYCLNNEMHLIIAEIRNLTSNESFTKHVLRLIGEKRSKNDPLTQGFIGEIFCCDQPFIKKENFGAIVEHAKQQKKHHGQLIKAGLSRTTAKSGNPHAADVITKVNKPKIDNAIVFALMLQPIIADYRLKGYSQRKMVNTLNEEGFTAPEGGHWVLSQLQKVLERIKMNEGALTLEKRFLEYQDRGLGNAAIAEALTKLGIPSPKVGGWNEEVVALVSERISQLHDIIRFHEFLIELMPVLEKYHVDELTEDVFTHELQSRGIQIPLQISV